MKRQLVVRVVAIVLAVLMLGTTVTVLANVIANL